MISDKADRRHALAGNTWQQLLYDLSKVDANAKIQDPASVFSKPDHKVTKVVNAVGGSDIFDPWSIPPQGSFIHGETRGVLFTTA